MALPLKKVGYTHEALIDQIIANPGIKRWQLAQIFGYSPGWLSVIMGSDSFKAKFAERKGEMVDPTVLATVEDRLRGVMQQSLEVLAEKLAQPTSEVSDQLVLKAAEVSSKALGYGAAAPPAPAANSGRLEELAQRLIALNPRREVYEGEAEVVPFTEVQDKGKTPPEIRKR